VQVKKRSPDIAVLPTESSRGLEYWCDVVPWYSPLLSALTVVSGKSFNGGSRTTGAKLVYNLSLV
jgi:hypothetical protein